MSVLVAAAAVAVTIAVPGWSASISDSEIAHESRAVEAASPQHKQEVALARLIHAQWVEGEARERNVVVADEQVEAAFEQAIDLSPAELRKYLRTTHLTRQDL